MQNERDIVDVILLHTFNRRYIQEERSSWSFQLKNSLTLSRSPLCCHWRRNTKLYG